MPIHSCFRVVGAWGSNAFFSLPTLFAFYFIALVGYVSIVVNGAAYIPNAYLFVVSMAYVGLAEISTGIQSLMQLESLLSGVDATSQQLLYRMHYVCVELGNATTLFLMIVATLSGKIVSGVVAQCSPVLW